MALKIWFTRGLSRTGDANALIRSADTKRRLHLVASHTLSDNLVLELADEANGARRTVV